MKLEWYILPIGLILAGILLLPISTKPHAICPTCERIM